MVRLFLFSLLLPCCIAAPIRRLDGSTISVEEADAFARKTLDAAHVTGAQIAVLDKGKLVWSAAYGLRRREPALPMERGTTTWAASFTKSVFATYVMQLVERGQIDLDLPVAKQLPRPLIEYEVYRETASALVADPAWAFVTPRMLLSHSSGLANFAFLEPDKKMRLHFQPGTQFQYSGEGMNVSIPHRAEAFEITGCSDERRDIRSARYASDRHDLQQGIRGECGRSLRQR